jgi:hypothetical protein
MRVSISARHLFILAFILLLVTNIVVLAGVAYNRSDEPDARINLTERELALSLSHDEENSGIALRIVWRVPENSKADLNHAFPRPWNFSHYSASPKWMGAEKLKALGFDTDAILSNGTDPGRRKINVPREAYAVLEYNGVEYARALSRAEARLAKMKASLASNPDDGKLQERLRGAEKWLEYERIEASRLFVVDAGADPARLRKQYPSRAQYVIARALVRAEYVGNRENPRVIGRIDRISVNSIHLPLEFRHLIGDMDELPYARDDEDPRPPRYAVELVYGSRLEPWIEDVRVL